MKHNSTRVRAGSESSTITRLGGRLLLVSYLVVGSVPVAGTAAANRTVSILHNNDLHFSFKHVDAIEGVIAEFRAKYEDVLLLNAGDFVIRRDRWEQKKIVTNEAGYAQQAKFMVETMNRLKYDALVPGNHDLGYEGTITRDCLKQLNCPVLGANVVVETDNYIKPEPFIKRTLKNGLKVAILGLSGGGFKAEGVSLDNPLSTFEKYQFLRNDADLFILLTHVGLGGDYKLADTYGDKIDVIVGGHSHSMLNPHELRNGVLIGQVGDGYSFPGYLGVMRLTFDAAGKCIGKEGEVLFFRNDKLVKPSRLLQDKDEAAVIKPAA